jgi:hypothetical protein
MVWVRILAYRAVTPTATFYEWLQANAQIVPERHQDCFLPHSFQFSLYNHNAIGAGHAYEVCKFVYCFTFRTETFKFNSVPVHISSMNTLDLPLPNLNRCQTRIRCCPALTYVTRIHHLPPVSPQSQSAAPSTRYKTPNSAMLAVQTRRHIIAVSRPMPRALRLPVACISSSATLATYIPNLLFAKMGG